MKLTHPNAPTRKLRRLASISAAVSLLLLFTTLLTGCFSLPLRGRVEDGNAPPEVIRADDFVPLTKIGITTRQQIETKLGYPLYATGDTYSFYTYRLRTGVYVMPLCFSANPLYETLEVAIVYDASSTLQGYRVGLFKRGGNFRTPMAAREPDETLFHAGLQPIEGTPAEMRYRLSPTDPRQKDFASYRRTVSTRPTSTRPTTHP